MGENKQYFHFTIGPVQGFVAQARRTRDFWAGSFILSWLSSVAMLAVEKQAGTIKFPRPDPQFMAALETGTSNIRHGNVPNRFKAEVPAGFEPKRVEESVRAAWQALAESVWEGDFGALRADTFRAREIWDRQIGDFWDIQWALVDEEGASNTLDRMKNWRTHMPDNEPGVKCMMMDGWQELSGAERPGRYKDDPQGPEAFWRALRQSGRSGIETDLREGEQLCSIAYVKRRFTRYFSKLTVTMPGGAWSIKGWGLPSGVPSVHYMAAAPWLGKLIRKANVDADLSRRMWEFHEEAYALTGEYGEASSTIRCVDEALDRHAQNKWKALDGSVFFDAMLENRYVWGEDRIQPARSVLHKLKAVRKAAGIEPVSPFYAVLLMDGDELGKQMSERDKQEHITAGLSEFTHAVSGIVDAHSGFLIYAGGDDVLAILPLEYALACAARLRSRYLSCFPKETGIQTSISAAIEFAHIKMPLGKILHDAHDLLDNVAKDRHGRDAVACRVWKPGGLQLEWAMPWEKALKDGTVELDHLAASFQRTCKRSAPEGQEAASTDEDRFASKFFYRLRERFDVLNPIRSAEGEWVRVFDGDKGFDQAVSLMAMEYLNSGAASTNDMGKARAIIRPLLEQCRHVVRIQREPKVDYEKGLRADGALLVRFLAQKGVER